jgi:hypothetical protein
MGTLGAAIIATLAYVGQPSMMVLAIGSVLAVLILTFAALLLKRVRTVSLSGPMSVSAQLAYLSQAIFRIESGWFVTSFSHTICWYIGLQNRSSFLMSTMSSVCLIVLRLCNTN